jgi:hypothetical protein
MMGYDSSACIISLKLRQAKNWFLLLCGATLKNEYGYKVKLDDNFKQIWDNPWRKTTYSLFSESWEVVNETVTPSRACIAYYEEKERNAEWKFHIKSF